MDLKKRKKLNHDIRAIAHGVLGIDEDLYRQIVSSVDPKSGGHITRCGDEEANLVYMHLRKMKTNVIKSAPNSQNKLIARLMDILGWRWSDTAGFCHRITGHRTTKLCNAAELSKVIRGMIGVIDYDLEKGKIQMTHTEKFEYERHTKSHRTLQIKKETL